MHTSSLQARIGRLAFDLPAAAIGTQILLKGIEKGGSFSHHPLLIGSLFGLGGFVLVAALLPLWIEKRLSHVHGLLHVAEGMAMTVSAVLLFEKGRLRLPLILLLVGVLYVLAGFLDAQPTARRERLARPMATGVGIALVWAGVVLAGFTAWQDHDPWAYGMAGLLTLVGAVVVVLPRVLDARGAVATPSDERG